MDSILAHFTSAKQLLSSGMEALTAGSNAGSVGASNDPNEGSASAVQDLLAERQDILNTGVLTQEQQAAVANIDKQIEEAVIQNTAPILILPEGKVNLPADADKYIENSELRKDNGLFDNFEFTNPAGNSDESIGNNTDENQNNNFDPSKLQDLGDNHFLDPNGSGEIINLVGSEDAPIYYQADLDGDPPQITYHVFYAYNDGPLSQNHEGDWERITVNLNPETLKPDSVTFSAHGHGTTVPYDEVTTDPVTGQPVIYVADGSHANYAEPGSKETGVPSSAANVLPEVEPDDLKDHTVTDVNGDGVINESDGAVIVDTSDQVVPVQEQEWYPEEGNEGVKWGEQGNPAINNPILTIGTDGPTGPSSEKGHQEIGNEDVYTGPPPVPNPGPVITPTPDVIPDPVPENIEAPVDAPDLAETPVPTKTPTPEPPS